MNAADLARPSGLALAMLGAVYAFQSRPFRVYPSMEPYDNVPLPADYREKTEWVFGRLMYPQHPEARFGRYARGYGRVLDWREGGTSWTQDYPRGDRHFAQILRRLTRIHVRSVEQPINLEWEDDVYNYPFLFAGEMGDWLLTQQQASKLRDFLDRGGFLMMDDFWGTEEWERFLESWRMVYPDKPILEIDPEDEVLHTVYDIAEQYQIPGQWGLRRGTTYRNDGSVPHFRAVYDDKGRAVAVITFNHDVGDSWEWADDPRYPERYSALGFRIGINTVIYSMTH
jgi:hypothetical protein